MNTILTDDEFPPLRPQDHPEPHSFAWTEQEMRAIRARDRLVEAAVLAKLREQEPVAYGMPDTQLGRKHRLMMVRLDKGQDGCTLPLYAAPLPAVVQVPPIPLNIIRKWPDGFEARLQHVWKDVISFIPNVKLRDLQRVLAEFGFRMEVYDQAAAPEAPAQAAQSAGEVERGDVVAFEFYNRATGHAIVDYSVNTHVGKLSADKGYEARPLVYADKREEVTDGSKPIPLWQAREALDELEAAARGDAPFNHQAAAVVRAALSHKEPQR